MILYKYGSAESSRKDHPATASRLSTFHTVIVRSAINQGEAVMTTLAQDAGGLMGRFLRLFEYEVYEKYLSIVRETL